MVKQNTPPVICFNCMTVAFNQSEQLSGPVLVSMEGSMLHNCIPSPVAGEETTFVAF